MCLSDYNNDLGIEVHEASRISDAWWEYLEENDYEDTFEIFKQFVEYEMV